MNKIKKNLRTQSSAFTFAEVLISLFVLTGSVYVLSGLHFRAARATKNSSDEIERVFFVKDKLYKLYINAPTEPGTESIAKESTTTIDEPELTISSYKQKIDEKKSELKDFSKELDIIVSEGTWKFGTETRSIKMISFAPKQKVKEKKV